jgi:hypothetical protein
MDFVIIILYEFVLINIVDIKEFRTYNITNIYIFFKLAKNLWKYLFCGICKYDLCFKFMQKLLNALLNLKDYT